MNYEIKGTVKHIYPSQSFPSGFIKREFVVTTNEQYPQHVKLELYKDKVEILDQLNIGDSVSVSSNIRGSEYQNKFFVNLNAWKIEKESGIKTETSDSSSIPDYFNNGDTVEDDLPF